mmetsp:Transcript_2090/g.5138  ORF Transcript_2090/g.5138 Transcript_2090/m.5138 type:complete len:305 (-) Transcript_2090:855-1769(-)
MVISTIAVRSPPRSFGKTSNFSASANTTNANSPPPESKKANFAASAASRRLGSIQRGTRVAAATVRALRNIKDMAPVRTVGSSERTRSESKRLPASMKKIPSKMPLNGKTSACICALKFVFAKSTPAANAPAVSVNPNPFATAPIPTLTNNDSATNVSALRVVATTSKSRCSKNDPAYTTIPNPSAAFAVRNVIAATSAGPRPTTYGMTTSRGATNRSCRSRIDVAACPASSFSHPLSFSTGNTNADVDSVPASASTTASAGLRMSINPSSNGISRSRNCGAPSRMSAVMTPVVSDIWANPNGR